KIVGHDFVYGCNYLAPPLSRIDENTSDNIPAVDINPESEVIEKMESPTKAEPESLATSGKDMDFAAMETEENADKKEEQVAEKAETDVSEEPAKEPSSAEEPNAKEATPTKEKEKKSPAKTSPKKSPVFRHAIGGRGQT
ncbi:hypothetical protein ANCDUO_26361, partial [Ancylostoma duodenale]